MNNKFLNNGIIDKIPVNHENFEKIMAISSISGTISYILGLTSVENSMLLISIGNILPYILLKKNSINYGKHVRLNINKGEKSIDIHLDQNLNNLKHLNLFEKINILEKDFFEALYFVIKNKDSLDINTINLNSYLFSKDKIFERFSKKINKTYSNSSNIVYGELENINLFVKIILKIKLKKWENFSRGIKIEL